MVWQRRSQCAMDLKPRIQLYEIYTKLLYVVHIFVVHITGRSLVLVDGNAKSELKVRGLL